MRFRNLSRRARLLLALLTLLSPVVLFGLVEAGVRLSGAETDLVPHNNVEIAIPAWLATDENFAAGLQQGMRAADVVWLRNFTEARHIWTKLKPNVSVDARNPYNAIELAKGITFHFSSNSDGFRNREIGPKPAGVLRVICIGDSSTFGWGVDDEYTYPRLIEARLNGSGSRRFEVINLGIPGLTSRHGLGMLRYYALALDPDIIVFSFGANDPRKQLRSADSVLSEDDSWRGAVRHAALKSRAIRLLRKLAYDANASSERYKNIPESSLVPAVSDAEYVANLRTMTRTVRAEHAQPVLLAVCSNETIVGLMRDVSRRMQVPMVDALPLLTDRQEDLRAGRVYPDEVQYYERLYGRDALERNKYLYMSTDGCHPNRAGMSLVADALAGTIAALPAAPAANR